MATREAAGVTEAAQVPEVEAEMGLKPAQVVSLAPVGQAAPPVTVAPAGWAATRAPVVVQEAPVARAAMAARPVLAAAEANRAAMPVLQVRVARAGMAALVSEKTVGTEVSAAGVARARRVDTEAPA